MTASASANNPTARPALRGSRAEDIHLLIERFAGVFRAQGLWGVAKAVVRRLRLPRARSFRTCRQLISGKTGIEIGGPSPIFARGGLLPLYPIVGKLDNCNFLRNTIWEGTITEGPSYNFASGKPLGQQFIAEATAINGVQPGSYDFVCSSHMLEHAANPLRALREWKRILRPNGGLILIVPHRDGTFDHRRPATTVEHLVQDFERNVEEDDMTHLPEILALHDLAMDPSREVFAAFRDRAEANQRFRSLHHHVFDTKLAVDAVCEAGFDVIAIEPVRPYHIIVVARNSAGTGSVGLVSQSTLLAALSASPFASDRQ